MKKALSAFIDQLDTRLIASDRTKVLQPLIQYILERVNSESAINLNLICTHNSRRSHLAQIWAQTMAAYFKINDVNCYSGGTEATALFPKVMETLKMQGFDIEPLSTGENPIYAVKFNANHPAIIGFSKTYDHFFNPENDFAAVMTCSHADENCPFIPGANKRIALNYEDPKLFDHTPQQDEKYLERSIQIATEMKYVFSNIKS
jgi:arsenate reductase